jgi:hypothetical protein
MAGHQRHPMDDAFSAQNGAVHRAGSAKARRPDLVPIAVMPRGDVQDLTPVIARATPGPRNRNLTPRLGRSISHGPAASLSLPIYQNPKDLAGLGFWGFNPKIKKGHQTPPIVAPARGGFKSAPGYRSPPILAGDHLAALDVPAPAKTILVGAALVAAFYFLAH